MTFLFGGPKPPPIPPPPPPPVRAAPEITAARDESRRRGKGRKATILTSPLGAPDTPNVTRQALLGNPD